MKISLGTWAFAFGPYAASPIALDRVLTRAAESGYAGVELSGFPPHADVETLAAPEARASLRRRIADLGLGVSGYSSDLTTVNPAAPGARQRYLDCFRRSLEVCAELGSPMIRVDAGAAPGSIDDRDYASAMARLAAIWNEAAALASPAGVRVAWEFEPGFAFNKPSEVVALHRAVAHPNFCLLFDTAHAYMCAVAGARQRPPRETLAGGVEQLLDLMHDRVGAIHLIDSDGTLYGEETSTHRPFGEGRIDFKALAPRMLALRGVDWWCIDLCFWPRAWEIVERARTFVDSLLPVRPPK